MTLPPLPEPSHSLGHSLIALYTADQMRAYAEQAIAETLEQLATMAGERTDGWHSLTAPEIRALK